MMEGGDDNNNNNNIFIELVFQRMDPRGLAQVYADAFSSVYEKTTTLAAVSTSSSNGTSSSHAGGGRLVANKSSKSSSSAAASVPHPAASVFLMRHLTMTMGAFRRWNSINHCLDVDISHGVIDVVLQRLGLTPVDLETKDSILWDTLAQQSKGAAGKWGALEAHFDLASQALEKQPSYQALLSSLPPQAAVCGLTILPGGYSVTVTNPTFAALFRGAKGFLDDTATYKTGPFLLFLSLVAPDDQLAFAEFFWEGMLGLAWEGEEQSRSAAKVLKMVDSAGGIDLYLMYFIRSLKLSPGVFFVFEPCPPSRHLTPRPYFHFRVDAFKQRSPIHGLEEVREQEGAGGRGRARGRRGMRTKGEDDGGSILSAAATNTGDAEGTKRVAMKEEEDLCPHEPPLLHSFPGLAFIPGTFPAPGPLLLRPRDKVTALFDSSVGVGVSGSVCVGEIIGGQAAATATEIDGKKSHASAEQALSLETPPPPSGASSSSPNKMETQPQMQTRSSAAAAATHMHTPETIPTPTDTHTHTVTQPALDMYQWVGVGGEQGTPLPRAPVFDEGTLQNIFEE